MKSRRFFMIGIIMMMAANAFCQTSYLLTFSGKDKITSTNVTLDSVYIKNETSGEATTITDTFLYLNLSTGISEKSRNDNTFSIYQNYENVKGDLSSFNVKLPHNNTLVISAYDIAGKVVCHYRGNPGKGIHTFGFEFGTTGIYLISATNGEEIKTFKAYNNGIGNANAGRITLIGSEPNSFDLIKKTRGTIGFTLGDQIKYVGYSAGYDNDTINDSPTGDMDYVFEFSNFPPSAPSNPNPVNGSVDQSVSISLLWSSSSDPEGDPVTYDIYFDTLSNPVLVQSNYTNTIYNLNKLDYSTKYYWKVIAKDDHFNSTAGNIWSFTTRQGIIDPRDEHGYGTITIGNKTWMAENLAYLPSVSGPSNGSNYTAYYYVYGYNGTNVTTAKATSNYQIYGVWYNWPAAMNGASSSSTNPSGVQGVCPAGWHLPSDAEWKELEMYLGMTQSEADKTGLRGTTEGGKMKETGYSHWDAANTGATNSSGFTALPGGSRSYSGGFFTLGSYGNWWSSTEDTSSSAWYRRLIFNSSKVRRDYSNNYLAFSVRCIKD